MALAVSINNVEKRYAGHVAVRELSLQVPKGWSGPRVVSSG